MYGSLVACAAVVLMIKAFVENLSLKDHVPIKLHPTPPSQHQSGPPYPNGGAWLSVRGARGEMGLGLILPSFFTFIILFISLVRNFRKANKVDVGALMAKRHER